MCFRESEYMRMGGWVVSNRTVTPLSRLTKFFLKNAACLEEKSSYTNTVRLFNTNEWIVCTRTLNPL